MTFTARNVLKVILFSTISVYGCEELEDASSLPTSVCASSYPTTSLSELSQEEYGEIIQFLPLKDQLNCRLVSQDMNCLVIKKIGGNFGQNSRQNLIKQQITSSPKQLYRFYKELVFFNTLFEDMRFKAVRKLLSEFPNPNPLEEEDPLPFFKHLNN